MNKKKIRKINGQKVEIKNIIIQYFMSLSCSTSVAVTTAWPKN